AQLLIVKAQAVVAAVALMQLRDTRIDQREVINSLALSRYTFEFNRPDVMAGGGIAQGSGQSRIQAQLQRQRRERHLAYAGPRAGGDHVVDVEIEAVDLKPAHMVRVRRAAIEPVDQQKVFCGHDTPTPCWNAYQLQA